MGDKKIHTITYGVLALLFIIARDVKMNITYIVPVLFDI